MKKKLTQNETLLVAMTLFGMFFGAGNLIFPVFLGQQAGNNILPASLGFILTAVGIPILGVAAIGTTHSNGLDTLSRRVSNWYGYAFTCLLYLTIGPFFAIPRCATTTFETGIAPLLGDMPATLPRLIFSLIFFALVLIFSLKPNQITTWVGRIITPAFLVFLAVLVLIAMIKPGAEIAEVEPLADYQTGAFFKGFVEGYNTMDAIAGLAFGIIVIDVIRRLGVEKDGDVARSTITSGFYTALIMAIIYVLTIIMGVQSRGLFKPAANGGIILAEIAEHYLGTTGVLLLAFTIFFACLKTAIGLVTSCSEMFVHLFPKFLSYRMWAIVFTVFSFGIANVGLTALIQYSVPVLMLLYPLAITLILLALTEKWFKKSRFVYAAVTAGAFIAAIFDFMKTLPDGLRAFLHLDPLIDFARRILPFFDLGFGWVVPSLIGLVIGIVLMLSFRKANAPEVGE